MQLKQKLILITFGWILLLRGFVLLINVEAKAPQKAQIAFSSDRTNNWEVYAMDSSGHNQRNLTNNPADEHSPS